MQRQTTPTSPTRRCLRSSASRPPPVRASPAPPIRSSQRIAARPATPAPPAPPATPAPPAPPAPSVRSSQRIAARPPPAPPVPTRPASVRRPVPPRHPENSALSLPTDLANPVTPQRPRHQFLASNPRPIPGPSDTPLRTVSVVALSSPRDAKHAALHSELLGKVFVDVPGFEDNFLTIAGTDGNLRAKRVLEHAEAKGSYKDGAWDKWPETPTQSSVLKWITELLNPFLRDLNATIPEEEDLPHRVFHDSHTLGLQGGTCDRSPDLLISGLTEHVGRHDWSNVRVVGELKQNESESGHWGTIVQLADYACQTLYAQPTRLSVHGFTICGDRMQTWLFDRAGAIASSVFSINAEPSRFLQAILFYSSAGAEDLGFDHTFFATKPCLWRGAAWDEECPTYDPTIIHDSLNSRQIPAMRIQLSDNGRLVRLLLRPEPIFRQCELVGRASTCWYARELDASYGNWTCVVKQQWRAQEREAEGELLKRSQGLFGVAQYVWHEDAPARDGRGVMDIVGAIRKGSCLDMSTKVSYTVDEHVATDTAVKSKLGKRSYVSIGEEAAGVTVSSKRRKLAFSVGRHTETPIENRVLSKMIMSSVGHSIHSFRDEVEMLKVLRDGIKGHRLLLTKENPVLHRDISCNNILIDRSSHPQSGFLIDLDLAVGLERLGTSGARHRTGTFMFMAVEILKNKGTRHNYRHDLESFFYVFLYLCTFDRVLNEPNETIMADWTTNSETPEYVGSFKRGQMCDIDSFGYILDLFQDDMYGLIPLANHWRKLLFNYDSNTELFSISAPVGNAARDKLYDDILDALQITIRQAEWRQNR